MTKIAKYAATGANAQRIRNCFGRTLIGTVAALIAVAALAAPAAAKPFQQYLNGSCTGNPCKINFAKVPAGQRLTVKNISCYLRLASLPGGFGPDLRAAQMLVVGANPNDVLNAVTLVPQAFARAGGDYVFSANHSVSAFADANQRFQAYIDLSTGKFSQVACHISGDMAKAT